MECFSCIKCSSTDINSDSHGQYICQQCGYIGSKEVCYFCKHCTTNNTIGGTIDYIRFKGGLYCDFHNAFTSERNSCDAFWKR